MFALKNKVQLIGNLGNKPEVHITEAGKKIARFSIATTSPTGRPHSLPLHRPGTATPPSTSPAPRSTPGPYKRRTLPPQNSTPSRSPTSPESPRPLPLSDYTPPRRNFTGDRRRSSLTEEKLPATTAAPSTLLRLVVVDNAVCPPRRPRWTSVSRPSPPPRRR
jgi:hypothetical protein